MKVSGTSNTQLSKIWLRKKSLLSSDMLSIHVHYSNDRLLKSYVRQTIRAVIIVPKKIIKQASSRNLVRRRIKSVLMGIRHRDGFKYNVYLIRVRNSNISCCEYTQMGQTIKNAINNFSTKVR